MSPIKLPRGKTIDVAALKQQIDMPALVSHWLSLQQTGSRYAAVCPFHDDNDPSLLVYPDHVYCFGCGKHADAIAFVMEMESLDFRDAAEWLVEHTGELPLRTREEVYHGHRPLPTHPIPQMTIQYWHEMLTPEIRAYYHRRLLTDETIDKWMLGWDGWAYVIPIWEGAPGDSEVYAVKLRRADEQKPKYYNLPGRGHPRLFNKHVLETAIEPYIFIGEFDTILADQDGLAAVTSTGGQSTWLSSWNKLFVNAERIHIVPDVGEVSSGFRIASQFGNGRAVVHQYPEGMGGDYTDFRRECAFGEFIRLVSNVGEVPITVPVIEAYWEEKENEKDGNE